MSKSKPAEVKSIEDDDETGTAKNDDKHVSPKADGAAAAEANLDRALELARDENLENDSDFTQDVRVLRALSLLPEDEKATADMSADKAAKGLPEGENDAVSHSIKKIGRRKFLVVVTDNYRKFARAL